MQCCMLLEPEERSERSQDIAADLESIAGTNSVVIVAMTGRQLAGSAAAGRRAMLMHRRLYPVPQPLHDPNGPQRALCTCGTCTS